jgi:F-type H+-transporting ATPase subunit a
VAADPLEHVVEHVLHSTEADLGFLTPEGKVTIFSDQIAMILLAGLVLILVLPWVARRRTGTDPVGRLVPTGSGNLLETICEYLRDTVARPSLAGYTDRFIKYVWTTFFFVLAMNLLGLVPFSSVTPLLGTHIGGTATGNIWVTSTLAVTSLGMWIFNGLRLGGLHYLAHFNPGPWWLAWLLVPLEIVGVIAKAFALAVRLFANMIAGHILLAVLLGFILAVGSAIGALAGFGVAVLVVASAVAINLLEIFVAFLQAYIFTFLTVLFLGQAIVFHHGHEHTEAHAH